jgi:hypothetical protein
MIITQSRAMEARIRTTSWQWIILAALVVVMLAQMWTSVYQLSVTSDEADHLHAGYRYLQCRDFGWNPEQPPLAKMVAALPLLAMNIQDPILSPCGMANGKMVDFQVGHDFLFANPESVLMAARMAASGLAILLLLTVWFFARRAFGVSTAVISGTLIAFEPNLLAHGSLVMTDVPAALGFVLAVYALYVYLSNPDRTRLVVLGLATGLALCLKHSTILLAVIVPSLVVIDALLLDSTERMRTLLRNLAALVSVMVIALVVLWGVYGFRYDSRPDQARPWTPARLESAHGAVATKVIPAIARWRILPQAYLIGLQDVLVESDEGKRMFLVGRMYPTGRWFYFPVAATIKFTLPTLLLMLVSAFAVGFWKKRKREAAFLLVPAAILLASAMSYTINIGIRHVLPLLPFLVIFAAAGTWSVARNRWWATLALLALLLFHAVSSLRAFPNYLSYSNELWGGPQNTYKYLSDSNADLGQALKMARHYVAASRPTHCWLIQPYNETASDYGIPCDDIYSKIPPLHFDGTLIVSSILVDGVMSPFWKRSASLFKDVQPKAKLGGSALFVYDGNFDLTPMVAAERLKLATSVGPRDPQFAIAQASDVLSFDPNNGLANAVLCYSYATLGEAGMAEQHCNIALKLMREDRFSLPHDTADVTAFMRRHGLQIYSNSQPKP